MHQAPPVKAFVQIAVSLANVGVFAGAFSFATVFAIPSTIDNFEYITRLLCAAFLLFATSLFIAIGIQYILRYETPSQPPRPHQARICIVHTLLIIGLLIGGFICLNLVLISIGQKAIGITGIILLGLIPIWYFGITWIEFHSGTIPSSRHQTVNVWASEQVVVTESKLN